MNINEIIEECGINRSEEEIKEAFNNYLFNDPFEASVGFACGIAWADSHPVSPWHDLRKNPQDLPIDGMLVLVATDESYSTAILESGRWHSLLSRRILAWMPIPTFEEGGEE